MSKLHTLQLEVMKLTQWILTTKNFLVHTAIASSLKELANVRQDMLQRVLKMNVDHVVAHTVQIVT